MRQSVRHVRGFRVHALDGELGKLDDFLFEEDSWLVRHLVVNTGFWLTGHKVLLSPRAIRRWDEPAGSVHVALTREEVEESPDLLADPPETLRDAGQWSEGWQSYFFGASAYGLGMYPPMLSPETTGLPLEHRPAPRRRGSRLFSLRELLGYKLITAEREVARVTDFLVEDTTFAVECLVGYRRHERERRLLLPSQVRSIDPDTRRVTVEFRPEAPARAA